MQLFRSARWFLLALLLSVVPASSYAGVFISVGFAPPVLPVYEQPICPQAGLMWTPGYWGYGDDGYFWVPGAWVPAPYEGALWTPGYWGWSEGLFVFHDGYWGQHVGYYGGVNYGFGYGGIGFAGGMWRGHDFAYNTAVVRVNENVIRNTYIDRTIVERNTIVNNNHVAFSGGPGGINHPASPEERVAERDQHIAKTSFQAQHESSFRADRSSYVKNNGGHPQNLVVARPLAAETHPAPAARPMMQQPQAGPTQQSRPMQMQQPQARPVQQQQPQARPAPQQQPQARPAPQAQARPAPAPKAQSKPKPAPQKKENK